MQNHTIRKTYKEEKKKSVMIIKKIFMGLCDEEVHNDLLKFSRGTFKDRYLIEGKKQSKNWTVKTGPEFANFFVKEGLKNIEGKIITRGILSTTLDLSNEIPFEIEKISQFQGVKKYIIDTELEPKDVLNLMNKYPRVFFALSFSNKRMNVKIKAKPPKSGKPSTKGDDETKIDFCTVKTEDISLLKELFWDIGLEWENILIKHDILITDIIYPKEMSKMSPSEVRENAKRKGKIIRKVRNHGKEIISEKEFVA